MAEARLRDKVTFFVAITIILALSVAAVIALSFAQRAQTAAAKVSVARPAALGNLAPAAIYTDSYEVNDSQSTASNVGSFNQIACSSGSTSLVSNATFYRVGLSTPATDQDWYKVTLGATLYYTVSVSPQSVSSDLIFKVVIYDPSNNQISSTISASPVISFYSSAGGVFYLSLAANNAATISDTEDKPYQVTMCSSTIEATVTATPAGVGPDSYEPNDTVAEAAAVSGSRTTPSFISVGSRIDSLSFYPYTNRTTDTADWFEFYGRDGSLYQITTLNVQPGIETVMSIYKPVTDTTNPTLNLVGAYSGSSNPNNRYTTGARGSQVLFQVPSGASGMYWIKITNTDPSPRVAGQTYSLQVQEIVQATSTPGTNTPIPSTSTPYPGTPDKFEYNGDFDSAALIAPNVTYDGLNFVPVQPPSQDTYDNDFYRLPVKQGIYYTCQTLNLAPGVDTNIIIYNGDRVGLGGNDDISPEERAKGNFASRFSWLASYTGNAYILVGNVNPPRANEAGGYTYSLRCDIGLPATATPAGTLTPNPSNATYVPATPLPPEPTMTPYPTPRSAQNLPVRPVSGVAGTATSQPTSAVRTVTLNVQIFNDQNNNGLLDPGEGIAGASVHLTDEQSGTPLAQSQTDADGRVTLSVINPGPVRLSVPLFGYSLLVNDPSLTVRIAVVTIPSLPVSIP
jgi:hypothetical protein